MSKEPLSEESQMSDADNAALMQKIERTIPPMNSVDAGRLLDEAKQKLDRLLNDPEANPQEIELTKNSVKKLEYLLENFELGMNVFRTAKGGRSTLRE